MINDIVIAMDKKGRKVVVINEILFKGRKNLPWKEVEKYLKKYIGTVVLVSETSEWIYIDKDFPDEYKGSEDTKKAKGGSAKAKANAVQGIKQMIEISRKTSEKSNYKEKNYKKASKGWLRYLTRFALPAVNEQNVITHYNVYLATLVVSRNEKGKLKLYDVVNIKKESETIFEL